MIGQGYWSTGIRLTVWEDDKFALALDFYDDGFAEDHTTEGTLKVRYIVHRSKVAEHAQTLKQDAETLGIKFRADVADGPTVYVEQDGEFDSGDRPDLREFANATAEALGWRSAYREAVA